MRVSMLDIHTVGAGGGSLARVDEGGLLRVGPESAGADPGPACYGKGELPTVTDAHVVLGRIAEDQLVGGEMHIDSHRAEHAIARIAKVLHLDIPRAAAGILRVANASMERAIRLVSVERGHDPRDFALVAFGGCGGLHACDLAEELGIRTVLVPEHAGVLSALGMLLADNVRDYTAGVLGRSDNIEREFRKLEATARKDARGSVLTRSADLRYAGQSYELNVPWDPDKPGEGFHREHQRQYGYSDAKRAVEVVTIRVKSRIAARPLNLQGRRGKPARPTARRIFVSSEWRETPIYRRDAILARDRKGPALVIDYGSTTLIPL
ncbi:MAG: hydantoinase/oxoprolinase family protein, partial [Gemmatimonadaceae bacterium]